MINGSYPYENGKTWILISCDVTYFEEHAPAFIYSAAKNNHNVHVNVVNANEKSYSLYTLIQNDIRKLYGTALSFTKSTSYLNDMNVEEKRSFYAASRFLVMPDIMMNSNVRQFFISDTDSIILHNLPIPSKDIGLFVRPNEPDEMKVAAGIVYISNDMGYSFINDVAKKILSTTRYFWFKDQIILNEMRKKYKTYIEPLDHQYMDWQFETKDVYIWTGKGDRKYNNQTYVDFKKSNNLLPSIKERFWI